MTAKQAMKYYRSIGIDITLRGSRLHIAGALTRAQRVLIAGHREALKAALRGQDAELRPVTLKRTMEALGFERVLTSKTFGRDGDVTETYAYAHVLGDEHGDKILAGLIDEETVIAQQKKAERRAERSHFRAEHPPTWNGPLSGDSNA